MSSYPRATLFFGILLDDVHQDDFLQQATGTYDECERAQRCDPCRRALEALGLDTAFVNCVSGDGYRMALTLKGKSVTGYGEQPDCGLSPIELPTEPTAEERETLRRGYETLRAATTDFPPLPENPTTGWYLTGFNF